MDDPGKVWRRLLAIARRQEGPIATWQAVAAGLARSTWHDRMARERWEQPFRGVFVLPGRVVDHRVRARAATLALGREATSTGRSALHLLGAVDEPPLRPHVVLPVGCRPRPLEGVRVTRSRTLVDEQRRHDAGIWIANVPRAFLDAASTSGTDRLRAWLIDARQRRLVEVAAVARLASSLPSTPGRGRLLAACADVADSGADSALVAEVERRLRAGGIHLDVHPRSVRVPDRELHPDLTVRGVPVAIEVDGFGSHSSRHALDLDQRKHNAYSLVGWVVLRIGWTRLSEDWSGFLAELRRSIERATDRA